LNTNEYWYYKIYVLFWERHTNAHLTLHSNQSINQYRAL